MTYFKSYTRRDFLKFMGVSAAALSGFTGCQISQKKPMLFTPLEPTDKDDLSLANGFQYDLLIKELDSIGGGQQFGTNNDYTSFLPLNDSKSEGLLWVNHEYFTPLFISGFHQADKNIKRTRQQVDREQELMGGSVLHIKRINDKWTVDKSSKHNQRYSSKTMFSIVAPRKIQGSNEAMGMVANCAGGQTPWGTFLTCEENYSNFYGEVEFDKSGQRRVLRGGRRDAGWTQFYDNPPEHYGWVCEIDPHKKTAKKLTALGRFAHESATVHPLPDGRVAVYSGDDKAGECLYKFVSDQPGSLEAGELFVANLQKGRWESLDFNNRSELKKMFKDQTDVLIRCREAARRVGGTPLDRPEDVEINPANGDVFVALSNNKSRGNFHGSLLKISHEKGDHNSSRFQSETFLAGGEETGFSCPDNLAFDRNGNLWVCCDVSTSSMNRRPYTSFKNNSLFFIPMSGPAAGVAHRVAAGPTDSEMTGITFPGDGKSMIVSVQHPGERSRSIEQLTSRWPLFDGSRPYSSVVVISGPTMAKLLSST